MHGGPGILSKASVTLVTDLNSIVIPYASYCSDGHMHLGQQQGAHLPWQQGFLPWYIARSFEAHRDLCVM